MNKPKIVGMTIDSHGSMVVVYECKGCKDRTTSLPYVCNCEKKALVKEHHDNEGLLEII